MAKKSRNKRVYTKQISRLTMPENPTRVRRVERQPPRLRLDDTPLTLTNVMSDVEDLRRVPHEVKQTRYLTVFGRPAGIVYATRERTNERNDSLRDMFPSMHARFQEPWRVLVCLRRKARRRVLFALRKMAKGRGGSKRAVWTDKSYISCK